MKPNVSDRNYSKKNGYQSDDDNVRYKLNTHFFNNGSRSPRIIKKHEKVKVEDDDNIRYKLATSVIKSKTTEKKPKTKAKIKVNFWSNKQSINRLHNTDMNKQKTNRRHTVTGTQDPATKTKTSTVKVRKRVSFLPSPLFTDNHVPMVTVPDDLTIQLNEEEANDLGEDLNYAFVNSDNSANVPTDIPKRKARSSTTQTSPKGTKRNRNTDEPEARIHGHEFELEFFSKYVVQKLRRMETNQRIYSENLINTVLMLGQLGKLNGKSKISDA